MNSIANALKDWVPYRLKEQGDDLQCRWLYLADKNFDEPFIDETLAKCRQLKENSSKQNAVSNAEAMEKWSEDISSIAPAAIIFHVSRCGSTLLSQLLALNPANIVLSEVPFFDELLRYGFRKNNTEEVLPFVKAAVSFYGAKRQQAQQHLFIKADSWHVFFYKEWRCLYPDVPFFFLYRRPDEVLQSQQKQRGMHAVQGVIEPSLFGFDDSIFQIPMDEYLAKVLEAYYTSFSTLLENDKLAFAFDYKNGMMNNVQQMMNICKINIGEPLEKLMLERSSRHSKYPTQLFSEEMNNNRPAYLEKAFAAYDRLSNANK